MKYISNSEKETIELGKKIAPHLDVGDVIILTGDLGSGKTKFVEGVLSYFGLQDEISSPTFTIVNEYSLPNTKLFHFDVYRLEDEDEFYAIGGDEYFENGISIIEWGERIQAALPKDYIHISFSRSEDNYDRRTINIDFIGNVKKGLEEDENFSN